MRRSVSPTPRPLWFGGIALAIAVPATLLATTARPDVLSRTALPAAPTVAPTAACAVAPLPTLGGLFGQAVAANQRGVAVGTATDATGASRAVLWRSGSVRPLSTGTTGSAALGVNERGDVVGTGKVGATPVGWVWSAGRTTRLSADPGEIAVPAAVDERGLVVGTLSENEGSEGEVRGQDENEQAAFWASAAAHPTVLSPLPGDDGGNALAVDNRGRIGGVSAGTRFRAVIWDAQRTPRALSDLGGGYAAVRALADSGLAVGDAVTADGADRPVMWDAGGRITQLELPAGVRSGRALAILADATVLGIADVPASGGGVQQQAVRWAGPGRAAVLSASDGRTGSTVAGAADVTGYVGYRTDPVGGKHPVLWRCRR